MGLSEVTLHEFHNRRGEVQVIGLAEYVTFIQFVLNHELSQVSYNLGGGCHLQRQNVGQYGVNVNKLFCEE